MSLLPRILAVCAALPLLLASCGFTPVYGGRQSGGGLSEHLAAIEISVPKDRWTQQLRAEMEDRFNPDARPANVAYRLEVSLSTKLIPAVVEDDGTISRYHVELVSPYLLKSAADGTELKRGTLRRFTSYNVSEADFASFTSQTDAFRRGVEELAEEYRLRLAAHFTRHGGAI